jgi:hypothetical protein
LDLLRVNSTIGYDAAAVLYSRNTFAFGVQHELFSIISRLAAIGLRNRTLLRHLIVSVENQPQPDSYLMVLGQDYVYTAMSAGLEMPTSAIYHIPFPEGEVENISRAIEPFIALLAQSEHDGDAEPLELTLDLDPNLIPNPTVLIRPLHRLDDEEYEGSYVRHRSRVLLHN